MRSQQGLLEVKLEQLKYKAKTKGEYLSGSATITIMFLPAGIVLMEQVTCLYFTNEVNQDPGKWVQTLPTGLGYTHRVLYQVSAVILAKLLL